MPYHQCMGLGGHGITQPTGGMPVCPRDHVQPCTPETRATSCPCGGFHVVPCDTMQPGTAWAWVGVDMNGNLCFAREVPMQTWRACAQPGRAYRDVTPASCTLIRPTMRTGTKRQHNRLIQHQSHSGPLQNHLQQMQHSAHMAF